MQLVNEELLSRKYGYPKIGGTSILTAGAAEVTKTLEPSTTYRITALTDIWFSVRDDVTVTDTITATNADILLSGESVFITTSKALDGVNPGFIELAVLQRSAGGDVVVKKWHPFRL